MLKRMAIFAILTGLLIASGCAGPTRLESDFGTSHKLMHVNQVLNPDASKNLQPVSGMDGVAARNGLERYRREFEKPPAAPVYTLGVMPAGYGK